MRRIYYKLVYTLFYLVILIVRKWRKNSSSNSKISIIFINWNNRRVFDEAIKKRIKSNEVVVLLPHCIQNYSCPYKITSDIDNCKSCNLCKIADIKKLKSKYGINAKVATGGTLARMFIKEHRPRLVIAVACERDLISGIYDAFPIMCYGVFNDRKNGPCINTDLIVEDIEKVVEKLNN